jgi:hypothetical protein
MSPLFKKSNILHNPTLKIMGSCGDRFIIYYAEVWQVGVHMFDI